MREIAKCMHNQKWQSGTLARFSREFVGFWLVNKPACTGTGGCLCCRPGLAPGRKGLRMPRVHRTAIVSAAAQLAADVTVGPYTVIDGPVTLGPGCVVRAHAHLIGPLTMGANNDVGTGCVIGDRPQHLAHKEEQSPVEIGDGNTFREHVTVHRGMLEAGTVIGQRNYFMAGSHVGHDCIIGDQNTFANAALLGGHVVLGNRTFLSGHTAVHQHVHIGDVAMLGGMAAVSQDIPPYWLMMNGVNRVGGVNKVGMRRAGLKEADIRAVRSAFKLIYLEKVPISRAVMRMEAEWGFSDAGTGRWQSSSAGRAAGFRGRRCGYTGLASEAA